MPDWVPQAARNYLAHTEGGRSIRALARDADVHASTVLRQIRRTEGRRDDPLVDDALRWLAPRHGQKGGAGSPETRRLDAEALPVLMRLAEPGAVLAVAREMEMGVVVRDRPDGSTERTAVVARVVAQALALRDWISCIDPEARISRYSLTSAGRNAVRELCGTPNPGLAEAATPFRRYEEVEVENDTLLRHARSTLAESPLVALARRREKDGTPFLGRELVAAGERLREDFELAEMGRKDPVDWTVAIAANAPPETRGSAPTVAAGERLWKALSDLGPGLADVALRCCCQLEGLETLEKGMGWSARSGKIVLRISLQRLRRHYDLQGAYAPTIG